MKQPDAGCHRPVLVVEDDQAIRETLTEFLQMEGYEVKSANNGKEALSLLEKMAHPCIVLLDLFMPVMDGITFLKEVKQGYGDCVAALPIVVVSAGAPGSEAVQTAKHLASGFIKKPIELELLLKIVQKHCA